MKSALVYVEKSTGSNHNGEAWIGTCFYSKSGLSIYFDGKVFKKESNPGSNYYDLETGEAYWISKVKKNGEDRHRFGKGMIQIDNDVVDSYLQLTGNAILEKNKFQIVALNNIPAKQKATEIENEKLESDNFDESLRFKNPKSITREELELLVSYYKEEDFSGSHKKARKFFKKYLEDIEFELERRKGLNLG
ncbi:MAG: hypothetical protein Q8K02_17740 [Flavobacterium sp.]|nr:hypothetical protein [Flavobacterium sp.]